nr:hypothetical protein [Tanacetum cinerariifolium]
LATSDSARRSSKPVGRTDEIGALEPKEGQTLILPWWSCAQLVGSCLYWLDKGRVKFFSQSLAGSQALDHGIVA